MTIGWCQVTTTPDGLRVDHADPEVLISNELLDLLRQGDLHPACQLNGNLLRIDATNGVVVVPHRRAEPRRAHALRLVARLRPARAVFVSGAG